MDRVITIQYKLPPEQVAPDEDTMLSPPEEEALQKCSEAESMVNAKNYACLKKIMREVCRPLLYYLAHSWQLIPTEWGLKTRENPIHPNSLKSNASFKLLKLCLLCHFKWAFLYENCRMVFRSWAEEVKWFNDYSLITCLAFKFPGLHVLRSHCQLCTCTVMAMHTVLFDSSSAASHSLYNQLYMWS